MTPYDFIKKWQGTKLTESAAAQSHFNDLCALLDHPPPSPETAEWLCFERGAEKTGGGDGWADVWKRGCFGWEYKGPGRNLEKAYEQLLEYREALENPPILVVCDTDRIEIHTNFTNTVKRRHVLHTSDLLDEAKLAILRDVFFNPENLNPSQHREQITRDAAKHVAEVFDSLVVGGRVEPHQAAWYLMRIVFCLFAEDVGLLPRGLIGRMANDNRNRPARFGAMMAELFAKMATGGDFGAEEIRHFDGGLFQDGTVAPLGSGEIAQLCAMAPLDWSKVEPSIFGGLLEGALSHDARKRARLGAHYTDRSEIELIVKPVLLDPLRAEWQAVQSLCDGLAVPAANGRRKPNDTDAPRTPAQALDQFRARLGAIRILDPACGSGNFLYVALVGLLDLDDEVRRAAPRWGLQPDVMIHVGPHQLHGLDLDPWAVALASTTVWIGYLQWRHEHVGIGKESPLLKPLDTIREMDAVLTGDGAEPDWPEADVIIGNPPFLGGKKLRAGLGDDYVERLFACYAGRVPREADLCCYWHEKARAAIAAGRARRAGLLATNSIRQGPQMRPVVQHIIDSGGLFAAWSDRDWREDGAAVRIAVLCFDDGSEQTRTLDGQAVAHINADLTSGPALSAAKRLKANLGIAFQGGIKGGPFELDATTAIAFIKSRNPLARDNRQVIRPWFNGLDVTRRPRGLFVIDFGEMTEAEAALFEAPFEYLRRHVYPVRAANRRASRAKRWWLHSEVQPALRRSLLGLNRFIATTRVAKHRIFVWVCADVWVDSALIAFASESDCTFGLLHSRAHEVWSRAKASTLEDRPRYGPEDCFETFPFPAPTPAQHEAISAAAKELHETRQSALDADPHLTLTALYNKRPTWLANLHARLDAAVLAAYGWPAEIGDEELLARLLALNLERAAAEAAGAMDSVTWDPSQGAS
jgi:methylase of polypeptide subunit release factors